MSKTYRIAHVISADDVFGPEKTTINECLDLMERGLHPFIINIWSEEDVPIKNIVKSKGIEYYSLVSKSRFDLSLVFKLRRMFKAKQVDLVHSHGYKSDIFVLPAAKSSKCSAVCSIHGWTSENLKVKIYERVQAFFWKMYDGIFAVSKSYYDVAVLKGVNPAKLKLLYNGILPSSEIGSKGKLREEFRRNLNINENVNIVSIIGRLSIEKNHQFFLDIASKVTQMGGEFVFLIAGDGDERASLQARIDSELTLKNVRLLGHLSDTNPLYASTDILIICSLREGLPNVMLEAMLNGIPVISSPVGGIPEVIVNGENGFLMKGDDPSEFANKIIELVDNKMMKKDVANNALNTVKGNFTFNIRMENIVNHYLTLINRQNVNRGAQL